LTRNQAWHALGECIAAQPEYAIAQSLAVIAERLKPFSLEGERAIEPDVRLNVPVMNAMRHSRY